MRAAVLTLVLVACGGTPVEVSRSVGAGATTLEPGRFPHELHTGNNAEIRAFEGRGLGCADCHDPKAVREGLIARPGANQHAPCDGCHRHAVEFGKPPDPGTTIRPFCKVCHTSIDPTKPRTGDGTTLQHYPERGTTQTLVATFSHRRHLDTAMMEAKTGSHVSCGDCHERNAETRDPMVPGHKVCLRCHEQTAAVKATLPMANCAGCHPQHELSLKRGRLFITGDLKFHHGTHETDRSGAPVKCATCHVEVERSGSRTDMGVPVMERCAQCHEDTRRSPDRVRMSNCAVCHAAVAEGNPPASHMVSGSRPTDHTLEFRKHHAREAAAPNANCRFCHQQVAGAREDSCFQCHQIMRPNDHNLMFRDDHGRAAQTDAARCASCHTPESCVACHSIPPRSHTPIADFRLGGHAQQARFSLTSCLACHRFEDTCAKCHRSAR